MSISDTLRKAANLQEKIDQLRAQLTGMLDKARAEIAVSTKEEISTVLRRRGRPKISNVANGRGPRRSLTKSNQSTDARVAGSPKRRSPLAGQKRSASPSGPLAPAVVKVLQSNGAAMNVRDILDQLFSKGYKFNSTEPKKKSGRAHLSFERREAGQRGFVRFGLKPALHICALLSIRH